MLIFKSKTFARWGRKEGLSDAGLLDAVDEMEEGNIDANLGGRVYKKRVALTGRGKRGSVRTLIAYQDGEKSFFMFGFAKNERSTISKSELKALKLMANDLLGKSDAQLKKALKARELIEVK